MAAQAVLAPAQVVSKCQLQCHNISLSLSLSLSRSSYHQGPQHSRARDSQTSLQLPDDFSDTGD